MNWIILSILFLFTSNNCNNLDIIRTEFHEIESEDDLENFLEQVKNLSCKEIEPFIASSIMHKSRYAFITKKMKYFKDGKKRLEQFISDNPNDVEAKYIRLLIQKEIPSFLNYDDEISHDSIFIERNIQGSALPKEYKKLILENVRK